MLRHVKVLCTAAVCLGALSAGSAQAASNPSPLKLVVAGADSFVSDATRYLVTADSTWPAEIDVLDGRTGGHRTMGVGDDCARPVVSDVRHGEALVGCGGDPSRIVRLSTGQVTLLTESLPSTDAHGTYVTLGRAWLRGFAACSLGELCDLYRNRRTGETEVRPSQARTFDLDLAARPKRVLCTSRFASANYAYPYLVRSSSHGLKFRRCGNAHWKLIAPAPAADISIGGGLVTWDGRRRLTHAYRISDGARFTWNVPGRPGAVFHAGRSVYIAKVLRQSASTDDFSGAIYESRLPRR
jgi:hypothetical protein